MHILTLIKLHSTYRHFFSIDWCKSTSIMNNFTFLDSVHIKCRVKGRSSTISFLFYSNSPFPWNGLEFQWKRNIWEGKTNLGSLLAHLFMQLFLKGTRHYTLSAFWVQVCGTWFNPSADAPWQPRAPRNTHAGLLSLFWSTYPDPHPPIQPLPCALRSVTVCCSF